VQPLDVILPASGDLESTLRQRAPEHVVELLLQPRRRGRGGGRSRARSCYGLDDDVLTRVGV
jgi:hypothetical protein